MNTLEEKIRESLNFRDRTLWELIYEFDATECEIVPVLNDLVKMGHVVAKDGTLALRKPQISTGYVHQAEYECTHCGGKSIVLPEFYKKTQKNYEKVVSSLSRGFANFFPQDIIAAEMALKAALIDKRDHLRDREILIIGDEFFFSALLLLTKKPKRVHVLEFREHILNNLKKITSRLKTRFSAHLYDVREPLPLELIDAFDLVYVSPLPAFHSMALHAVRGINALKENGSVFYMEYSPQEVSARKLRMVQEAILTRGLAITDAQRQMFSRPHIWKDWDVSFRETPLAKEMKFSVAPPGRPFYYMSLMRAEVCDKVKMRPQDNKRSGENIFHDEEMWNTPGIAPSSMALMPFGERKSE